MSGHLHAMQPTQSMWKAQRHSLLAQRPATTSASYRRAAPRACLRCSQSHGRVLVSKVDSRQLRLHATQTPRQEAETEELGNTLTQRKADGNEEPQQSLGVRVALSMLQGYKNVISPLLPPSCRYLPTCSAYAMEAYQEYGVAKGTVLTAWRLLRCSPFGSNGYDPVQWPPPGLEWAFKQ